MVTVLLLACYLPMALVPAVLPFRVLRPLTPTFPLLSIVPLTSAGVALLLAQPLTNWLGYAVALIPLFISLLSLTLAAVGARLTLAAHRGAKPIARLVITTALAAIPFALTVPFLVASAAALVESLAGP